MWFKNGLKAQKLLAQGSALGLKLNQKRRPERAKALNPELIDFSVKGETGDTQQLCGLCKISITQGNGTFDGFTLQGLKIERINLYGT